MSKINPVPRYILKNVLGFNSDKKKHIHIDTFIFITCLEDDNIEWIKIIFGHRYIQTSTVCCDCTARRKFNHRLDNKSDI